MTLSQLSDNNIFISSFKIKVNMKKFLYSTIINKFKVEINGYREFEKKLTNLDKELHSIMELVRKANASHDVVDDSAGAWGYEVDGKEFVQKLKKI